MKASFKNTRRGFGLAELVITLSVIGVLTALAAPMFSILRDSAGSEKSKRNAHHLAQLAATAVAAGDQTIPAAGSLDAAVQLIVDGVSIDDIIAGMSFQLDLSEEEITEAKKHLHFTDGNLIFEQNLNERR